MLNACIHTYLELDSFAAGVLRPLRSPNLRGFVALYWFSTTNSNLLGLKYYKMEASCIQELGMLQVL